MTLADTPKPSTTQPSTTQPTEPKSDTAQTTKILLTVLGALVAWGLAIFTWGVPGLYLPAVAMVPVIMATLVIVAKG